METYTCLPAHTAGGKGKSKERERRRLEHFCGVIFFRFSFVFFFFSSSFESFQKKIREIKKETEIHTFVRYKRKKGERKEREERECGGDGSKQRVKFLSLASKK